MMVEHELKHANTVKVQADRNAKVGEIFHHVEIM